MKIIVCMGVWEWYQAHKNEENLAFRKMSLNLIQYFFNSELIIQL